MARPGFIINYQLVSLTLLCFCWRLSLGLCLVEGREGGEGREEQEVVQSQWWLV